MNMRTTRLIAVLVGLAAIAMVAADAHAIYHPGMGTFLQRDPGAGASGPSPIGAAGPAMGGGFAQRDPMPAGPARVGTPMHGHVLGQPAQVPFATPARPGAAMPPRIGQASLNNQYADGMNLYQYVRNSPVNLVDPAGLAAVDPGKDCGLSSNSDWKGLKPIHFWIKGRGQELWDFGPDMPWIKQRYGDDDYFSCGIFKYCRGEANWSNNSYAGRNGGTQHLLKLQGDFLFVHAKLRAGPKKGTQCKCATCGDIKGCLDAVRTEWNSDTRYDHWFRHCGSFVLDAMNKCCLRE